MTTSIARPAADEYPAFFAGYVATIADQSDGLAALERQRPMIAALAGIPAELASYRYGEGKWTVKDVIGHVIDAERVFSDRLLRIARGDQTPLPAFDENTYAQVSNAARREVSDLVNELRAVREASIALVRSLEDGVLGNRGTVRAGPMTARAQVFIMAGHFAHHAKVLTERYGVSLPLPRA
jgi:uncharacterized damage-inducible protein DinB